MPASGLPWAASALLVLLASVISACGSPAATAPSVAARLDFARPRSLYDAPFPGDDLRRRDGTIDVSKLPNPKQVELIAQGYRMLARDARGFGASSGTFFAWSGALDPRTLPTLEGSTAAEATVFLLDLERLQRHPVRVAFAPDGGPFGAPNLLSLLPVQGLPLRGGVRYAAVVRRGVRDVTGSQVEVAATMRRLAGGDLSMLPEAARPSFAAAVAALLEVGVSLDDVAALTAFTTDRPELQLEAVRKDALRRPLPVPTAALQLREVFPDFCVYASTLRLPSYQQGEPPFAHEGGAWAFDGLGAPKAPKLEEANLVVTVPRRAMPAAGFPTVVMVRTGAGGDRPLVDRGQRATNGGPAITPGTGPGREFARVGFAGVSVDGPLGGRRNVTQGDEQFLVFNVFNAEALRDNVRQSAVELIVLAHALPAFRVDARDCPGVSAPSATVRFDPERLAIFGHSMGATIAPLAVAVEPRYRAMILSGAGGSWIENILRKRKPLDVRPIAEALLDYGLEQRTLTAADPALSFVQWAAEPADPQVYGSLVAAPRDGGAPRHVLMLQGIVDRYILPSIANAVSLPLGLDLAGPPLDARDRDVLYLDETPLAELLPLTGHRAIDLPVTGNQLRGDGHKATAIVVQHLGDQVEDGHEAAFQTEPPKHQYSCFLESLVRGTPRVPKGAPLAALCD